MITYKTVERPSYLGKKRDAFVQEMNAKYGNDNWRFAWKVGKNYLPFEHAIFLYEGAYFVEMYNDISFWRDILLLYRECYDNNESNINSGLDYSIQETSSNHYQDIAVRRVMLALGLSFGKKNNQLIWVRHNSEDDGADLSPGRVKFHIPDLIEKPELTGWWNPGSVESFWQSGKVIQVIEKMF